MAVKTQFFCDPSIFFLKTKSLSLGWNKSPQRVYDIFCILLRTLSFSQLTGKIVSVHLHFGSMGSFPKEVLKNQVFLNIIFKYINLQHEWFVACLRTYLSRMKSFVSLTRKDRYWQIFKLLWEEPESPLLMTRTAVQTPGMLKYANTLPRIDFICGAFWQVAGLQTADIKRRQKQKTNKP